MERNASTLSFAGSRPLSRLSGHSASVAARPSLRVSSSGWKFTDLPRSLNGVCHEPRKVSGKK